MQGQWSGGIGFPGELIENKLKHTATHVEEGTDLRRCGGFKSSSMVQLAEDEAISNAN